ncbi:MAG: hypothetical protein QOI06_2757 [Nocardioidaceae bacterium]|jgi:hypothetical protein|nr:hypothetical protein [Nocardioidaceae bacterium]
MTLQIVLSAASGVAGLWLVVLIGLDRLPGDSVYAALGLIEIGLVVQLVVGLVMVFGGHDGVNVAAYVGYLVGALLILPVAVLWSLGERTRAGTGVLLVGVIVIPALCLRLHDLWTVR